MTKFNAWYRYTNSHPRPSSNKNRAMDIEKFYIEKRGNFVCFISELRAEWSCGLSLKEPKHNQGCYNIIPDLDFTSFEGYKILLKAVIASGSVDSYVEKFLLEDGIDVERLPADRLAKIKRYLEMFSELLSIHFLLPIVYTHRESQWTYFNFEEGQHLTRSVTTKRFLKYQTPLAWAWNFMLTRKN